MHLKNKFSRLDWPRVILVLINVPFLIALHIAFLIHVMCTILFYLLMARSIRDIGEAFAKNYRALVIQLFK